MDLIHNAYFTIRTQEIDQHKHLSPPGLIMLMQEASMEHVVKIKASYWDLASRNVSWVLLRKELKIYQLPQLGDKVHVQTYPSGFERIFAYRDFKVFNANGALLATASSTWTLIDLDSRRPSRIPEDLLHFAVDKNTVDCLDHANNKIPQLSQAQLTKNFVVHWYDLDWNNHVNNVFLARCLLETFPDDYLQDRELLEFSIHFKAESFWKDKLDVSFQELDHQFAVGRIVRTSDGKEIAHSYSRWK